MSAVFLKQKPQLNTEGETQTQVNIYRLTEGTSLKKLLTKTLN